MENASYLNNLDTGKVEEILSETEQNTLYFEDVSKRVVESYSASLDTLMQKIYQDVVMIDYPSLDVIEKYFLELTNTIYFVGEKLESLGIRDDMSKAQYKEIYNKAYLDNQVKDVEKKNKTTVAENQAVAESAAIYEGTVNSIYSRAYKIVKYKIDAANEMVKSLSKIISRRLAEIQIPDRGDSDIGGTPFNG